MTVDPQRRAAARIARQVQRGVGTVEFEGQPGAHERLGRLAAVAASYELEATDPELTDSP